MQDGFREQGHHYNQFQGDAAESQSSGISKKLVIEALPNMWLRAFGEQILMVSTNRDNFFIVPVQPQNGTNTQDIY